MTKSNLLTPIRRPLGLIKRARKRWYSHKQKKLYNFSPGGRLPSSPLTDCVAIHSEPFDKLRACTEFIEVANGQVLSYQAIPFVVRLSNHERDRDIVSTGADTGEGVFKGTPTAGRT